MVNHQPRIRIAMLGSFPPQAQGIQDYCGNLVLALAACCDVHALGFRAMYPSWLFPGVRRAHDNTRPPLRAPGLTVDHTLAWYNPPGWLASALALRRIDIFHLQWWSAPLFPVSLVFLLVMKLRRIPIVATIHNVLPHEAGRLYRWTTRIICALSGILIVHSAQNRAQLLSAYQVPPKKVRQFPMGIALQNLAVQQLTRTDACNTLGLDVHRIYILSFGVIRDYKGIDILLHAFASLARVFPDADLIIAGKPWLDWSPYAAIIDQQNLYNRIHLALDYIPEEKVPLYFAAADIIVLPYRHFDAQSAVGAIALPWRKPLIVSDVGGLPEWVGGAPEFIARAGDPADLAAALRRCLTDPLATHANFKKIADTIAANHAWQEIIPAYNQLYREIMSPPPR